MSATRWAAFVLCAAALAPVTEGHTSAMPGLYAVKSTAEALQTIAIWLERSGEEGWMGADVADALEILRLKTEDSVAARQRAFRTGDRLHLVQGSADERREFLLFMVKGPDQRVHFYLSTVSEGYKRGFVTVPGRRGVAALEADQGERGFRSEVSYWQGIMATR
jgi:hypothetical protein